MIKFQNVIKSFGSKTVLDGLTVDIPKGKITFIVGKSGEGKSVTIKHIMGLLKPNSGSIVVAGQDITDFSKSEIIEYRKRFGMLFQHAALFDSLTVEQNVVFPLKEHTEMNQVQMLDKVNATLKKVGLEGLNNKYPSELSTGEKKEWDWLEHLLTIPR